MNTRALLLSLLAAVAQAAPNPAFAEPAASLPAQDWPSAGGDRNQDYFSPLHQIDTSTASRLGFAWSHNLGTARGGEATPVVVGGVMYTAGYIGIVYALDAATGRELWRFVPKIPDHALRNPCCDAVNRGVAVSQGRVYVASLDGVLHALDAATGQQVWQADTIADHTMDYSSTGAPVIAHTVVVIGNGGADMGKGGVRGYISGYDLNTGALKWRFFTVPPAPGKPPEHPELAVAEKTWDPQRAADYPGGGTVWDGITYDPVLNLLYFGTGNAAPYDVRKLGPKNGDDLFTCSIVALDPETGRMAWYYQTTPGDRWDFDAVQKLVLADISIGGAPRQVVMQANKNGFFYVLDRKTGALISAKPFTYVNWASGVDPHTGRPVVTPQADYYERPKNIYPSWSGGHTWPPMSYDPATKLVYIPVVDVPNIWLDMLRNGGAVKYINGFFSIEAFFPDDSYSPADLQALYGKLPSLASLQTERKVKLVRELIRAWDPVAQKIVWEHETSSGMRGYDGGVLSTAGGLVLQGRGNGELVVYEAATGKILKTIDTGSHIMAAPMSYAIGGTQYIAVQTGYGGAGISVGPFPPDSAARLYDNQNRIIVFRLDGGAVPKPPRRPDEAFPPPPPSTASADELRRGEVKFAEQCSRCHVFGPSVTPDLRKLTPALHAAFETIVLKGTLGAAGMERFDDLLSAADVKAIHAYLIDQQRQGYVAQQH
jgi:quinohemoprotein ethanol dehydrogenase